jgi:hypothetical protein
MAAIIQSFTENLNPPNPEFWLKNITLRVTEGFLRWYLATHVFKFQSGLTNSQQ